MYGDNIASQHRQHGVKINYITPEIDHAANKFGANILEHGHIFRVLGRACKSGVGRAAGAIIYELVAEARVRGTPTIALAAVWVSAPCSLVAMR